MVLFPCIVRKQSLPQAFISQAASKKGGEEERGKANLVLLWFRLPYCPQGEGSREREASFTAAGNM